MNREQVLKVANRFMTEHEGRCPDPSIADGVTEIHADESALTTMVCRTCGVTVTRTRWQDDWNLTWIWPQRDPDVFHPGGCPAEPRAHTHDEHGDVQISLVP